MHGSFQQVEKDRSRWAMAAAGLSVAVALTLIVAKLVAWIMSGSTAVLGSLADSSLDLIGSLVAFVGVRWASEPPDAEHRFGHGKAEAVSSLTQIVLISGSALFVAYESVKRLIDPEPLQNGGVAMGVMALSLTLSIGLVAFQSLAIRKSGSLAVEGDQAHYTGDIIANGGTLVAVFLAVQFGWLRADAIAGLAAALFLAHAAWSIGRRALPQLMDEELPKSQRARIAEIVHADEGVIDFHALRTRRAGQRKYIQMHLDLDPDLTLRDAHAITDRVELALHEAFPGADIILHMDPHGESEPHDKFGARTDIDHPEYGEGSANTP
ncbi:cation diffusion facilitator family transporter [Aquisalinus luteolus]|nr:cation diffusion facilitator family transporter [Aquisalinus luteolus]